MSCSMSHLWAYDPERCDYHECPMNCDRCVYAEDYKEEEDEDE